LVKKSGGTGVCDYAAFLRWHISLGTRIKSACRRQVVAVPVIKHAAFSLRRGKRKVEKHRVSPEEISLTAVGHQHVQRFIL
jgi:hypothetical protein